MRGFLRSSVSRPESCKDSSPRSWDEKSSNFSRALALPFETSVRGRSWLYSSKRSCRVARGATLKAILIAKKIKVESRKTEPLSTRLFGNERHMHSGRSDIVRNRKVVSLVASIRTAVVTGVISGELARTLNRWGQLWSVPQLPDITKFRHNTRLRTTIARWFIGSNTVELSTRFFDRRLDQQEILCHELAHAVVVRMRGRSERPHGAAWCELLRKAGYEPRTHVVSGRKIHTALTAERPHLIYEHRCPVCHAVRYGKRTVKSWRCAECVGAGLPGHLIVAALPISAVVK